MSFSPLSCRASHSCVPPSLAGFLLPLQHLVPISEEKKEKDLPALTPTPQKSSWIRKLTNKWTPQSTHHKKNPQTHRTARTQYFFFFFFFFEILVTMIPRHDRYKCNGLSPGVATAEWSSLRWLSETGALLSNGLVSSAAIYYLSISQCGRRRKLGGEGGEPERRVMEMETGTATTLEK